MLTSLANHEFQWQETRLKEDLLIEQDGRSFNYKRLFDCLCFKRSSEKSAIRIYIFGKDISIEDWKLWLKPGTDYLLTYLLTTGPTGHTSKGPGH